MMKMIHLRSLIDIVASVQVTIRPYIYVYLSMDNVNTTIITASSRYEF